MGFATEEDNVNKAIGKTLEFGPSVGAAIEEAKAEAGFYEDETADKQAAAVQGLLSLLWVYSEILIPKKGFATLSMEQVVEVAHRFTEVARELTSLATENDLSPFEEKFIEAFQKSRGQRDLEDWPDYELFAGLAIEYCKGRDEEWAAFFGECCAGANG